MQNQTHKLIAIVLLISSVLGACNSSSAAPVLDGTAWQLLEMNGKPLPVFIQIDLEFSAGQAGGRAPCNGYGAAYTQNGYQLSFEPGVSTMMYCEGVMDYELEFNEAFAAVKSFQLEGDRLSLLNADGKVVLVFGAPQAPPSLEGSAWKIVQVGELSTPAGVEATLTFAESQATGLAACNNFFAAYTQDGQALRFDQPGATKMFCGEEGVMAFETALLASLGQVRTFTIEIGRLVLLDEAGTPLVYLAPGN